MKTLVLIFSSVLFLAACAKEEIVLPSLTGGVWKTPCVRGTLITGDPTYMQVTATYDGQNHKLEATAYADSFCTSKTLSSTERHTYVTQGASNYVTDGVEIDYTLQEVTATVYTAPMANTLNGMGYCAKTWTVGQSVRVDGSTCGGTLIPTAGTVRYDVYEIVKLYDVDSGATSGDLLMGSATSSFDGTTAAKRYRDTSPLYFTKD